MLVGVISDTHDHAEELNKSIEIFNEKGVELIIHCGDWVAPFMLDFLGGLKCKVISVFGNNEAEKEIFYRKVKEMGLDVELHDRTQEVEIGDKKGMIYHGTDPTILIGLIDSQKFDVVFTGHTHKAEAQVVGGTLKLNPGSVSGIYKGRLGAPKTIAIYDSDTNSAEILEVK